MRKLATTLILAVGLMACGTEEPAESVEANNEETTVEAEPQEEEVPEVKTRKLAVMGTYMGKNIRLANPFSSTGIGWCVKAIELDNQTIDVNVDMDTIEVDLMSMGLVEGAPILVGMVHEENCKPTMINFEDMGVKEQP